MLHSVQWADVIAERC